MNTKIKFQAAGPTFDRQPQELYAECMYHGAGLSKYLEEEFNQRGLRTKRMTKRQLIILKSPSNGITHDINVRTVSGAPVNFLNNKAPGHTVWIQVFPGKRFRFYQWRAKKKDDASRKKDGQSLLCLIDVIMTPHYPRVPDMEQLEIAG